jgi:hypothetical protein
MLDYLQIVETGVNGILGRITLDDSAMRVTPPFDDADSQTIKTSLDNVSPQLLDIV